MTHEHFSTEERTWYVHQAGGRLDADVLFGLTLRRLRQINGLTLRNLAGLTYYSHVYLWQLEKAVKQPSRPVAAACDRALNGEGVLDAIARGDLWRELRRETPPCPQCWAAIRTYLPPENE